jgi:hypothetical protein
LLLRIIHHVGGGGVLGCFYHGPFVEVVAPPRNEPPGPLSTTINPRHWLALNQDDAMTTMTDNAMCEVRHRRGPWRRLSAKEALPLNTQTEKRCVECHGRVLALQVGGTTRIQHAQAHSGCTLGATYDGHGARFHPAAVV